MGKKRNNSTEYDKHIIDALIKLHAPILGKEGKQFYLRDKTRNETGLQHIANKNHRLKVRDIESVPSILRHPKAEMVDPNNKNYRNYYGIRDGKDANSFLKIVTWPDKNNPKKETIITIYPTKTIKIE